MEFLENISDLLHHFSFDGPTGDKYREMKQHSPTLKKAKEGCRNMDLVREANRMKKEADLRKEQEAREKSTKEMKNNEDELRDTIRQDARIREDAHNAAVLFMNDNADNSILHKHCETKITRAIGEKSAPLYAKFTYILGIATVQDLETLFDVRDHEMPQGATDEGQEQGGLTRKTAPKAGEPMYASKYEKAYPPEPILSQQAVEVHGNGSPHQYMGKIPSVDMLPWIK
eukprot:4081181-Amphidinium_carterae.2